MERYPTYRAYSAGGVVFRLKPPAALTGSVNAASIEHVDGTQAEHFQVKYSTVKHPLVEVVLVGRSHSGMWALPKGTPQAGETIEQVALREVQEETGLQIKVCGLLAADFWGANQLDLLYRCKVESGTYQPSDETGQHRWVLLRELPELLPNQRALLRKAGLFG